MTYSEAPSAISFSGDPGIISLWEVLTNLGTLAFSLFTLPLIVVLVGIILWRVWKKKPTKKYVRALLIYSLVVFVVAATTIFLVARYL
jgi:hypothetical protein